MNTNGTGDMPEPQVLNYTDTFKITDRFVQDLGAAIREMPYIDGRRLMDTVASYDSVISIGPLNELIRQISQFPFKYVEPVMRNIEKSFVLYFEPLKKNAEPEKK